MEGAVREYWLDMEIGGVFDSIEMVIHDLHGIDLDNLSFDFWWDLYRAKVRAFDFNTELVFRPFHLFVKSCRNPGIHVLASPSPFSQEQWDADRRWLAEFTYEIFAYQATHDLRRRIAARKNSPIHQT